MNQMQLPVDIAFRRSREEMVAKIAEEMGIIDPRTLNAMREVPRHLFVEESLRARAYDMTHLFIMEGVTISYPGIVAYMVEKLRLQAADRVLDIGGGTGYHAAVMSRLAEKVISVEIVNEMVSVANDTLAGLGYDNVRLLKRDGILGCVEEAPFDAINVVCTVPAIPIELVNQLRVGGRMILPIGPTDKPTGQNAQKLVLVEKTADPFVREGIHYDSFYNSYDLRWIHVVPMVHKEGQECADL